MPEANKDATISKTYYDVAGYGSQATTLRDARKTDKTITKEDVASWFDAHVGKRAQAQGVSKNSFVAPHKGYEYQIDVFFIKDLETEQKYEAGFVMIDIFTRYAVVIPIKNRTTPQISLAIIEGIAKMKEGQGVDQPELLYGDDEGAWSKGDLIGDYLKKKGIKLYITRNHGAFAERFIRTFKDMLYKRMDSPVPEKRTEEQLRVHGPLDQWHSYIFGILLTYNNKLVHSSTGMTPKNASKGSNEMDVKSRMEAKAIKNRRYPEIKVGDKVKIRRKKKTGEKERLPPWGEIVHEVIEIKTELGQRLYTVDQDTKGRSYTRGEILKL